MENEYELEIVETNLIDGGIEVFARAWKNGVQLGFGKDGTVDIERFRIFNPPILVDDPLGNIVQTWTDVVTEEVKTRTLTEDPEEAVLQSLTDTIRTVGKEGTDIVVGSRGNTTSTFYSITNGDGTIFSGTSAYSQAGFDTEHDRTTGSSVERGTSTYVSIYYSPQEARTRIRRGFLPFDTSAISDGDTIDSATLSVWGYMAANAATTNSAYSWVNVVQTTQANTSSLATADYDTCGAVNNPTEGATRILYSAMPATSGAAAYISWTLDATGKGWVDKTGVTKLGLRDGSDALDQFTSGLTGFDKWNAMSLLYSDATGTANDPKLVVEHSAGSSFTPSPMMHMRHVVCG